MPVDSDSLYVLKGSGLFTGCEAEASFDAVRLGGGVAPNAAQSIVIHVEAKIRNVTSRQWYGKQFSPRLLISNVKYAFKD